MNKPKSETLHMLTRKEERANTITHAIFAFIVLIFIPVILNILKNNQVSIREQIGVVIFLISIFLMLLMSAVYHGIDPKSPKKVIGRRLDHIFIFVAIAGSHTPIALSFVWNLLPNGKAYAIALLCLQWLIVLFGILFKSLSKSKRLTTSLPLYFAMACIMLVIIPLLRINGFIELYYLLIIGGLFYGLGVILFAFKKIEYTHTIWHFCVIFGALFHIIGLSFYLCY